MSKGLEELARWNHLQNDTSMHGYAAIGGHKPKRSGMESLEGLAQHRPTHVELLSENHARDMLSLPVVVAQYETARGMKSMTLQPATGVIAVRRDRYVSGGRVHKSPAGVIVSRPDVEHSERREFTDLAEAVRYYNTGGV